MRIFLYLSHSVMSYDLLTQLGIGHSSKTYLARRCGETLLLAVKIIPKNVTLENREVQNRCRQLEVLRAMHERKHAFILHCIDAFQTTETLCIVTPFMSGGDLGFLLQRQPFTDSQTRLYSAEICLALGHLHERGILHRNLRLEHVLMGSDGHIVVSGFGCCIPGMSLALTTSTFTGCGNFMPPEVLLDKPYGRAVDWWALGVLVYQMAARQDPFRGEDEDQIYDVILSDDSPEYPADLDKTIIDILQGLLRKDPEVRLGASIEDVAVVMKHDYFRGIQWDDILHKRGVAPFIPTQNDASKLSNFSQEFTALSTINLRLGHHDVNPGSDDVFADFDFDDYAD